jgi:hypothetical protein
MVIHVVREVFLYFLNTAVNRRLVEFTKKNFGIKVKVKVIREIENGKK